MLALAIGSASFLNSRLVMRHGARRLSNRSLSALCCFSVLFLGLAYVWNGHPPLTVLLPYLLLSFFCIGLLMGNLNALAMQPLGHVAGTGAAIVGGLSTFISLLLGTIVGQSYDETVLPLAAGFAVLGALGLVAMRWAEGRMPTPS
jgi:DHA1 family bicyclomycin/chloramphenicol resistance-like MFS transporter